MVGSNLAVGSSTDQQPSGERALPARPSRAPGGAERPDTGAPAAGGPRIDPPWPVRESREVLLMFTPFTPRIALTALSIGLVAGCGGPSTGPAPAPDYFPLAVGNRWTYAPEDPFFGDPFEWRVTGRAGASVTLARPAGGSHPGPVTLRDGRERIDLLLGDEGYVPLYRFAAGATWVRRDPWACDDGAIWAAEVEPGPVTTPAGTFRDCLRLVRRTPATCEDAGTMREWWAPDVGLVKWEELNFFAGGPLSFLLVDYDVE